jgi:HrpA-like RNA helicase
VCGRGMVGVCQPRRVAATSTAARVAYELGVQLGKEVGVPYPVRLKRPKVVVVRTNPWV